MCWHLLTFKTWTYVRPLGTHQCCPGLRNSVESDPKASGPFREARTSLEHQMSYCSPLLAGKWWGWDTITQRRVSLRCYELPSHPPPQGTVQVIGIYDVTSVSIGSFTPLLILWQFSESESSVYIKVGGGKVRNDICFKGRHWEPALFPQDAQN